jgi:hypothetical protein
MPDDHGERIAVLEEKVQSMEGSLSGMDRKLDAIMTRGARMETDIKIMAPSVAILRDGLVFVKWGRWLAGAVVIALSYGAGILDWIAAHVKFIATR